MDGKEKCSQICEHSKNFVYFCRIRAITHEGLFDKNYLGNLYEKGDGGDKKHCFQPQVVKKYKRVVDLMIESPNVLSLAKYNSLHYEKLEGDKKGLLSVRVNDQYQIEFEEIIAENEVIATICNITDLSNHYQ